MAAPSTVRPFSVRSVPFETARWSFAGLAITGPYPGQPGPHWLLLIRVTAGAVKSLASSSAPVRGGGRQSAGIILEVVSHADAEQVLVDIDFQTRKVRWVLINGVGVITPDADVIRKLSLHAAANAETV